MQLISSARTKILWKICTKKRDYVIDVHEGTTAAAASDVSLSGTASRPDQPGAHRRNYDNDHMKDVEVPFGGDQLTRQRFAGAKDLRRGCHTAKDKFEHCSPFTIEMFHTKMAFVQVIIFSWLKFIVQRSVHKKYPLQWRSFLKSLQQMCLQENEWNEGSVQFAYDVDHTSVL